VAPGALTEDDLRALWHDVTDEGYWKPLEKNPDSGIEGIEQTFAQNARVSTAVEQTTQACYIFPWSGQTAEPATGASVATVQLTVTRNVEAGVPVVFERGLNVVHVTTDWGDGAGQEVTTGRRYPVQTRAVFLPGDTGPLYVQAMAEQVGTGYNLPQPGTIRRILVSGTTVHNAGATVVSGNRMQLAVGSGDILAPAHVLSYIQINDGPNAGQTRRIVGYSGGSPAEVQLDDEWILRGALTGMWQPGETVEQAVTGAIARVVAGNAGWLLLEGAVGVFTAAGAIVGKASGASFTVVEIAREGSLALGNAAWRLLDWEGDLGVGVTNEGFPSGGRFPMLDEVGEERNIPRAPGEDDVVYRSKVGNPADVVTPNAIRRTVNHLLAPYGVACCFRQVESPKLPGLFYDVPSGSDPRLAFAYDMPMTGVHRFKRWHDLLRFRAYFMLGVPSIQLGQFGFAYDVGKRNAYDVNGAYDGFAVGTRKLMAAIRVAVERARMGGVRWDLYIERLGCT